MIPVPSGMTGQAARSNGVINVDYRKTHEHNVDESTDDIFHGFMSGTRTSVPSYWIGAIEFSGERYESSSNLWITQHPSTDIDGRYDTSSYSPIPWVDEVWPGIPISVDNREGSGSLRHVSLVFSHE